jgi:hypothetical protein
MARDEDDDLYDEEFDFVDEDDESDLDEESSVTDEGPAEEGETGAAADGEPLDEEAVDEYGRPEPAANYVVHVYEHKKFKRTIDRPFTPEDAEAFATEFNRTGKSYGRVAVSGKNDAKPKKSLD